MCNPDRRGMRKSRPMDGAAPRVLSFKNNALQGKSMQSKQWMGLMVLGLATATPAFAAGQADAKGFVEDSSLNVLLRNAYINRDYKGGRHDSGEWGQGAIANFESGFTQGTVGFGVDAFAAYAIRLDCSRDRAGYLG